MNSSFLGIDLSLTGTGLALIAPGENAPLMPATYRAHYSPIHHVEIARLPNMASETMYARWASIENSVSHWAAVADVVVIEGYSYGSAHGTQACMEIGGIVRYALHKLGKKYIEVPPFSLKKFLTGKTNSDKNLILMKVLSKWGIELEDDNMADALVLAKIGLALEDPHDSRLTQYESEVLDNLLHPKSKSRKGKGKKL